VLEELLAHGFVRMPWLVLASELCRLPVHTVPSKLTFDGGFIGGFRWAVGDISIENQLLEADPELQVQNIE
jgi:hypothetical protein